MNNKSSGTIYIVAIIIISILSVASMIVWAHEGELGALHSLQNKCASALSPVTSLTGSVKNVTSSTTTSSSSKDIAENTETVDKLKEQIEELTASVAKGEEYRQEAQRLQELLNLKDQYSIDGVTGHVIGKTTDSWNQTVTLDVGEDDGSFVGATVCTKNGVIGQVTSITSSTSTVRLVSDPQSGVSGCVQSNRATCIVSGSLDGLVTATNFSSGASVNVGDVIITSGLGGSFSKGIIIGTVSRVSGNASDGTLSAVIGINADTDVEEAIVVKSVKDNG